MFSDYLGNFTSVPGETELELRSLSGVPHLNVAIPFSSSQPNSDRIKGQIEHLKQPRSLEAMINLKF